MKKILTTLMVTVTLLTAIVAWDKATAEAFEATEMETTVEETVVNEDSDVEILYTVDEAKSEVYWLISDLLVCYEEDYNMTIEMRDKAIEICESIVYDSKLEYGFDYEQFQKDWVQLYVDYELLPEVCSGMTIEEINQITNAVEDLYMFD